MGMQAGFTSCVTTKATLSMNLCLGVLTDTWSCHLLGSSAHIAEQIYPRGFQQKQRFAVSLLRIKQATPTNPEDTQSLLKTKRNLSRRAIGGPRSLCDLREDALLCKPFPEFLIMRVEISYSSAFAKKTGNLSSTTSHQTLKVNSKCLQNCILYLVNLKQTEY